MIKWVVLTYHPWDNIQLNVGITLDKNPLFGAGFLVVFDSEEEAKERWPEKDVCPIRFTKEQESNVPRNIADVEAGTGI